MAVSINLGNSIVIEKPNLNYYLKIYGKEATLGNILNDLLFQFQFSNQTTENLEQIVQSLKTFSEIVLI